jgi:hypothetical protein
MKIAPYDILKHYTLVVLLAGSLRRSLLPSWNSPAEC